MTEYHKIQTVFFRDPKTNMKTLLEGQFSCPEFEYLANNEWIFTEKVDGTNIRVMFDGVNITFGGRTDNAQIPTHLLVRLQETFFPQIEFMREKYQNGFILYGEGYGEKIQKIGGKYIQGQDFVLFDVNIKGWWLERKNIEDIAQSLDIHVVPIIGHGTIYDMIDIVKNGLKSTWGDFESEGIVARPSTELQTRSGQRIITKIKGIDFPNRKKGNYND